MFLVGFKKNVYFDFMEPLSLSVVSVGIVGLILPGPVTLLDLLLCLERDCL